MGNTVNLEVRPLPGEHPERTIKRFTKKIKKMKLLEEVRERRFYEKPSDKRRKEKARKIENAKKADQESHMWDRTKLVDVLGLLAQQTLITMYNIDSNFQRSQNP